MNVIAIEGSDELGKVEAFLDAAYKADYGTISNNLAYGLSADVVDDDHTTALQIASAQGNLSVMQILLNNGASVEKCNHCGFTPLLHAARNGKAQAIELLIQYDADPFRTTFYGTTALSLASAGGHARAMAVLRKYESQTRRCAPTPLISAIARKQYQTVIYLEFEGVIQHPCRDKFYELDIFQITQQLMDFKMTALLRDLGLRPLNQARLNCFDSRMFADQDPRIEISRKRTDIRCLIRDHQVALVDRVLDTNDYSGLPAGVTPLMYAAVAGNVPMVQTLLRHNCDINAAYHHFTSLMIAIVCGNDAVVQFLIRKGANRSTNGYQFSLFELASNSDGISPATTQLILTESVRKMCLVNRLSGVLEKICKGCKMSEMRGHQPIKLDRNARHISFLQRVVQNMGAKSNWVPEELFDVLAWPDSPSTYAKISNMPNEAEDERIMVNIDEQKQFRYLLSKDLAKRTAEEDSPTRAPSFETVASLTSSNNLQMRPQQCSNISKLQSVLFNFNSGSPKNINSTTSSPHDANLSTMFEADTWHKNEIPVLEDINEMCLAYEYEKEYWNLLNRRCSPDVCQKLEEQEVDCETFLMLTKKEFISFGINRSDAGVLISIQKILKEEQKLVMT
uniref:SAM domain-containing protein n=1 Tax=Setaria digitata TaxID=48799 RepID=A0A915PFQ0_9BILA